MDPLTGLSLGSNSTRILDLACELLQVQRAPENPSLTKRCGMIKVNAKGDKGHFCQPQRAGFPLTLELAKGERDGNET